MSAKGDGRSEQSAVPANVNMEGRNDCSPGMFTLAEVRTVVLQLRRLLFCGHIMISAMFVTYPAMAPTDAVVSLINMSLFGW